MPKIALFADVQNIYYTTRERYARQFDYRALWRRVEGEGQIVWSAAYAIDRGDPQQRKFQRALEYIGFTVKLKPYIQRRDGSSKGDWDVGITIDVLEVAAGVDVVVLLSGDGDFAPLLGKVRQDHGVRAEVYGVPGLTARALIDAADVYRPIDGELLIGA